MAIGEASRQEARFPVAWLQLLRKERVVLAVAASISSFMDREGRAWPSRSAIAKRAGVDDPRAITKAIARICELGIIRIETRRGRSTIYSFPLPSVVTTQGSSDPGLSQPSTLGNGDRGTLGNGDRVELIQELDQRTVARAHARGKQKKADGPEISTVLPELLRRAGYNGSVDAEGRRIDNQCRVVAGGNRIATRWLALANARELGDEDRVEFAIRQTLRGEHWSEVPDDQRAAADAEIRAAREQLQSAEVQAPLVAAASESIA